jgi:hypothetical protein
LQAQAHAAALEGTQTELAGLSFGQGVHDPAELPAHPVLAEPTGQDAQGAVVV